MKPKYIKDAIMWNGRVGAWLRVSDLNYVNNGKECYWTTPLSWPVWRIHQAYPYEDWMEEYIGTNKNLTEDKRFKKEEIPTFNE